MQTLHAGHSNAEPKIFTPPQTPFPGAQDGQNLISWRWSLPLPTDPVWWKSMHAISSYCGNRHRPPARCKHTNTPTGPITIHCAAKLSAQCNNQIYKKNHMWKRLTNAGNVNDYCFMHTFAVSIHYIVTVCMHTSVHYNGTNCYLPCIFSWQFSIVTFCIKHY